MAQFLRLGMALPALAGSAAGRKAASDALRDVADAELEDDERDAEELDDEDWLARLPVVEPDPAQEAARREALLSVRPKVLRRVIGEASLRQTEQLLAASDPDPTVYEAWFARQPKPPRSSAPGLPEEYAAVVEHVTRHNPPWIRGPYLGYYRPPVPAELFRPEAANDRHPPILDAVPAEAPAADSLAELQARVARLLDRAQPRRAMNSTSPRRSAPSNGRNGRPIAARSTCRCCVGCWSASASTAPRSTGWAATSWPRPAAPPRPGSRSAREPAGHDAPAGSGPTGDQAVEAVGEEPARAGAAEKTMFKTSVVLRE